MGVFPIVTPARVAYNAAMRINAPAGLRILALAVATIGCGHSPLHAAEPTALQLVKEGNKHVGEDARDKVVQIRSDKSIGSLTPNVWYMVYYDLHIHRVD